MLQTLAGKWHLQYSDFPMWNDKSKSNVNFNYAPAQKNGVQVLSDEVRHERKGEEKSISGFDYPVNEAGSAFIWRGKGLLVWLKCPWQVEWINEAENCIILSFEKTMLTPAGIDIICKDKFPEPQLMQIALAEVRTLKLFEGGKLFAVKQH